MKRRLDLIGWLLVLVGLTIFACELRAQDRIFASGFEEGAPGGEIDPCLDPLVMPAGFALKAKTWVDAFSRPGGTPAAQYPNSVGNPVPVPGYEWFRRLQVGQYQFYTKGQFVAIGFVAQANTTVDLTWDTAQSGPNYSTPRPADSMFVGVSACPWDARPTLLCSRTSGLDSLFLTSKFGESACPLIAGQTYYINVLMADPSNGFADTCSTTASNSAEGCDVQMRHSGY